MKKFKKGFTIIELLVVLAVIGVFSAFAYPNISNWIEDRNIKKEITELETFIKEMKLKSQVENMAWFNCNYLATWKFIQ